MQTRRLAAIFIGWTCASSASAIAQTIACVDGGTGGHVPVSGTGGGGSFPTTLPPHPGVYTLDVPSVPPGASVVSALKLIDLTHTWMSDLQLVLTAPAGVSYNVFLRSSGSCDLAGDYTLMPGCSSALTFPSPCSNVLPPGNYNQFFGLWPDGACGLVNTALGVIPAQSGVWTLRIHDWAAGDVGYLGSWGLCFGAAPLPTASAPGGAPTPTAPQDGAAKFGPTIELMWFAEICATSYDVEVDGVVVASATSSSFAYASTAGAHDWRVRSRNSSGVGPWSVAQSFTDLGPLPPGCSGPELTTLFAKNTSLGPGSIVYFDVDVLRSTGILVSELDTNTGAPVDTPIGLEVYVKSGSYVGAIMDPNAWTLISSGVGRAAGVDRPTLIDVADFQIPFGLHALGLRIIGGGHMFTNGTSANQFHANKDLSLSLGLGQSIPFTSLPTWSSRVWNGTLRYDCIPPPAAYCTAGTSTHGCSAAISASAQPSATFANACRIEVAAVEGERQGLIFYGVDNAGFTPLPWGGGSTSSLCVQSPLQRMQAMNSGGASGACDGALVADWNAFQAAQPAALGAPFLVGAKVYVQAWFRDPPAPRATNASNAIELTVGP